MTLARDEDRADQTPSATVDSKLSGVRTSSSASEDCTGRAAEARRKEEARREKESRAKASIAEERGPVQPAERG